MENACNRCNPHSNPLSPKIIPVIRAICVILNPLSPKIILVIRAICVISLNPLSQKIILVIRVICGRYHSTNHLSMVRVSLEKFTPIIYVCLAPP